jgi:hypothetical protein
MSIEMPNSKPRRHPDTPRFPQRGEGSRASRSRLVAMCCNLHVKSLARLNTVALRDDAVDVRTKSR